MSKALAIVGLILLIVGIIPIILPYIGFGAYVAYFHLGFYELVIPGLFTLSELMLILIILGVILLIVGAVK
jgi:hypothetical protein